MANITTNWQCLYCKTTNANGYNKCYNCKNPKETPLFSFISRRIMAANRKYKAKTNLLKNVLVCDRCGQYVPEEFTADHDDGYHPDDIGSWSEP